FVKRGLITVEEISIIHDELPSAEQYDAGSQFVAEFCLYREKGERQLLIAFEFVEEKSRNDFLVGRSECKVPVMAVFHAHQFRTIRLPPSGFFPEFFRMLHRQDRKSVV